MIKFKIKTPQNYIEILKLISIKNYTVSRPDLHRFIFIGLFLLNVFILIITFKFLFGENYGVLALFITFFLEVVLLFKLENKFNKIEKKQLTKRFYKIFNIRKKDNETIEFIKNNIDFIETLNLSNEKLINLIKNHKIYIKEITEIQKENNRYKDEISNLNKKYSDYKSHKITEFSHKITEFSQKIIKTKQKIY